MVPILMIVVVLFLATLFITVELYGRPHDNRWFSFLIWFISLGLIVLTIYPLKIINSKYAGLILDEEGMIDNTTFPNNIKINWNDITLMAYPDLKIPNHFYIYLDEPLTYINKTSGFQKLYYQITNKFNKTPIIIYSYSLKCSAVDLFEILRSYSEKYISKSVH